MPPPASQVKAQETSVPQCQTVSIRQQGSAKKFSTDGSSFSLTAGSDGDLTTETGLIVSDENNITLRERMDFRRQEEDSQVSIRRQKEEALIAQNEELELQVENIGFELQAAKEEIDNLKKNNVTLKETAKVKLAGRQRELLTLSETFEEQKSNFKARISKLKSTLKIVGDKRDALEARNEELGDNLEAGKEEIAQLEEEMAELKEESSVLEGTNEELREESRLAHEKEAGLVEEMAGLKESNARFQDAMARLEAKSSIAEGRVEDLEAETAFLKGRDARREELLQESLKDAEDSEARLVGLSAKRGERAARLRTELAKESYQPKER